jgi:hypothetical protein
LKKEELWRKFVSKFSSRGSVTVIEFNLSIYISTIRRLERGR